MFSTLLSADGGTTQVSDGVFDISESDVGTASIMARVGLNFIAATTGNEDLPLSRAGGRRLHMTKVGILPSSRGHY